jgi:hypothetical protein
VKDGGVLAELLDLGERRQIVDLLVGHFTEEFDTREKLTDAITHE